MPTATEQFTSVRRSRKGSAKKSEAKKVSGKKIVARKATAARPKTTQDKAKQKAKAVTKPVHLRIDSVSRSIIDRAANVCGQTRTEFMVMSARERAIEILLDQSLFVLGDADFMAFSDALNNPPPANAKLKALLRQDAPWDVAQK